MATLTFLGSAAAVPTIGHDNTFLVVEGGASTLLIDCAGSPLLKLQLAGIEPTHLDYVALTHRHPDHIYGFPALVLGLWLLGCEKRIEVVGEAETLVGAQALLAPFHPEQEWPGFCPPLYREVTLQGETVLWDLPDLLITAAPTEHLVPSMAIKVLNKATAGTVVYSSDTSPCQELERLARGVDLLIHEASGAMPGHSSAAQAGQVAKRASVGKLYLIHYPVPQTDLNALVAEAQRQFGGQVELARDFGTLEF